MKFHTWTVQIRDFKGFDLSLWWCSGCDSKVWHDSEDEPPSKNLSDRGIDLDCQTQYVKVVMES